MITDLPPQLILPERPAIIRPTVNLTHYFPVEIDRKTRRAIITELTKRGALDDRAKIVHFLDKADDTARAAIPFGMFAVAPKLPLESVFITSLPITGSLTFTGVNIGAARSDRLVVALFAYDAGGTGPVTAATIGGIVARINRTSIGTNSAVAVCSAMVPTGTTATFSFTAPGSSYRAILGVVTILNAVNNIEYNANSPAGGGDGSRSTTLNVPKNGTAVAVSYTGGSGGFYTGLTERYNTATGGCRSEGASNDFAADVVGLSVGNTQCRTLSAVSFAMAS